MEFVFVQMSAHHTPGKFKISRFKSGENLEMFSGDFGGFLDFTGETMSVEEALQKLRVRLQDRISAVFEEQMMEVLILLNGMTEFFRRIAGSGALCTFPQGIELFLREFSAEGVQYSQFDCKTGIRELIPVHAVDGNLKLDASAQQGKVHFPDDGSAPGGGFPGGPGCL